ncbi:MAG: LysR family transcriptional regulator, partial [Rhodospirillaceae bacterium]|nr:LysR family transcriptional regulator [Rhodospirillaceae bacterium]
MEIRTLHAFVEVVRQGGFSAAAKTVFATQSTVSKAVKQLEDELGLPLYDRTRMTPTTAGTIVFRRAQAILTERDDLLTELDELRGLRRGELHLGISPIGGGTLFAPLFATFRKKYPDIDIRLQEHGSKRLEDLLAAGDVDLAASLLPVGESFAFQAVKTEPMVAILPAHHPASGRKTIDLAAIGDTPVILFDAAFAVNRIISDAYRRRGLNLAVAARSGQMDFMVQLVA